MCEIKKLLFSVSAQGNPMAQIWVDEADITKNSESIYIALRNQVAFLFFSGVGSKISLKKSKQYYNVVVPDMFTNLFENYKVAQDPTVKAIGFMMNQAFENCFKAIEFIKNGEVVKISKEEAKDKCFEYMKTYTGLYDTAVEVLVSSKNKALNAIGKILTKEDSKPSEVKEANVIAMGYANLLNREVLVKNNFLIEEE